MIYPINHIQSVIRVGVQTERGVEEIGFDMTPWMTRWPGMTFAVWVTRPGEEASYPAADVEMIGNVLYWYPNGTDTEKEGAGRVEVVGIGEGKCKSTGVMDTLVKATTLDVTQKTPETIRPWAEKVMEAAQAVKTAVDAGEGTLYLIRQNGTKTDRTYDEINAAINAKKTCILTDTLGRVHLYSNRGSDGQLIFRAIEHGVPLGGGAYTSITEREVHIDKDGKVSSIAISPINAPNPKALTIEQNGETVTYDGKKAVKIKIEGGGVPDPGKAFQQLVSDADGKAVWQEQIAYKYAQSGVVDILKEETLAGMGDADGDGSDSIYIGTTQLAAIPEIGKIYEVILNGEKYTTTAQPLEDNGEQIGVVLGNPGLVAAGEDNGERYAALIPNPELQAAMGGATFIVMYMQGKQSITFSIRGQGTITTTKKIDPDLLPETHKTITIMIDADNNVMCDVPFAEVSKMTCGELQSVLKIVRTGTYGGQPSELEADVQVRRQISDVLGEALEITFRQFADPGDYPAAKETTRYIYWAATGLQFAKFTLYSLPIMDAGWGYNQQTYYLRSVGGKWEPVSIEQMKKDLGLT